MKAVRSIVGAMLIFGACATSAGAAIRTISGSVVFDEATFSGPHGTAYGALYNISPGAPVRADFQFTFDESATAPGLPGETLYAVSQVKLSLNGVTAFDQAPQGNDALLATVVGDFGSYDTYAFQLTFSGDLAPAIEGLEEFQFVYRYTLDHGVTAGGVPTAAQISGHIVQTISNMQVRTRFPYPDGVLSRVGAANGLITTVESTVPEPNAWALLIGGFGLVGGALRKRKRNGRLAPTLMTLLPPVARR